MIKRGLNSRCSKPDDYTCADVVRSTVKMDHRKDNKLLMLSSKALKTQGLLDSSQHDANDNDDDNKKEKDDDDSDFNYGGKI